MAVFWVVVPYNLIEVYQRFRGPCCLYHQGKLLPDCAALQPRRQPSSTLRSFSSLLLLSSFYIPGYCRTQDSEEEDALAREGSSSPFLGPEPAISISSCVSRLKVKEWLKERHPEHWAAALGMMQSKHFIRRPSDKPSRDLLALDRKQCRLLTGLLTGHVH
jgi:hypothetical protein